MCFEKTLLITKEYGPLDLKELELPALSHPGIRVWHATYAMGDIQINEMREENYSIWYFDYRLKGPTTVTIKNPGASSIALSFTLKKNQHYDVPTLGSGVTRRNHYNLTHLPEVSCDFIFGKGDYATFGIAFSPDYLRNLSSNDSELFNAFISSIMEHRAASFSSRHHEATPPIMDLVHELSRFRVPGKMRGLYIKSKVIDLLRLSIDNMLETSHQLRKEISASDEKILYQVRAYLLAHLYDPGTLPEIAHRFAINEYKLKLGFKVLFQQGVIAFAHDERLKVAKAKISATLLPMKQIANEAGYKNSSNFTTAFRKRFGYSPGSVRRAAGDEE